MKNHATKLLTITAALAAMLLYCTPSNAAPRNGGSKSGGATAGNAGGNAAGNVNVGHDGAVAAEHAPPADVKSSVDGKAESKAAVNVDANRAGVNVNVDGRRDGVRDGDRTPNIDRRDVRDNRNADAKARANARLGDREFDRNGIGLLTDRDYRNRSDNRWRYQRYGNEWWYWVPQGYWMFYRGDRWNRYDADNYIAYDTQPNSVVTAASYSGPFYEDQNGFYYMDHGRKVYDNQIRRVGQ